jgi:predicted DNA repair protein MutK
MKTLTVAGTAAMFLVGGSILAHGVPPLHAAIEAAATATGPWHALSSLALELAVGVVAGGVLVAAYALLRRLRGKSALPV